MSRCANEIVPHTCQKIRQESCRQNEIKQHEQQQDESLRPCMTMTVTTAAPWWLWWRRWRWRWWDESLFYLQQFGLALKCTLVHQLVANVCAIAKPCNECPTHLIPRTCFLLRRWMCRMSPRWTWTDPHLPRRGQYQRWQSKRLKTHVARLGWLEFWGVIRCWVQCKITLQRLILEKKCNNLCLKHVEAHPQIVVWCILLARGVGIKSSLEVSVFWRQ